MSIVSPVLPSTHKGNLMATVRTVFGVVSCLSVAAAYLIHLSPDLMAGACVAAGLWFLTLFIPTNGN